MTVTESELENALFDSNGRPIQVVANMPHDRFRIQRKTVTFAGASANGIGDFDGTGNPVTLFTVTGDVVCKFLAVCSVNLAFAANATIEVGTAASTAAIIAQTNLTTQALAAREIWHDATPDAEIEASSVMKEVVISDGNDVILTVGTANVNTGSIVFYCMWYPLSTDGDVVAA